MSYYCDYDKDDSINHCVRDYGNGDRDWAQPKGSERYEGHGRYEYNGIYYRTKEERDIAHWADHI